MFPPRSAIRPTAPPTVATLRAPAALGALAALLALGLAGCSMPREGTQREERVKSALPLAPQTALTVETHAADIHFLASPDDSVHVVTWKRVQGLSRHNVDLVWNQLRVTVERAGNELILRTYEPDRSIEHVSVNFGRYHYHRSIDFELTIAVPAGHPVTLRGDRGDVTAFGLASDLAFDLHSGEVRVDEQRGRLDVETSSGDVAASGVAGPTLVRTHSGDVQADSLLAGAEIHSASGNVSVTRSGGLFTIETTSGDVKFKTSHGRASVRTGSGDIELFAQLDTLIAESTSGDQELELLGPPLHVSAQSSSGDVTVTLPPDTGGQLEIETSSGTISAKNLARVTGMSRTELTGDLGGKGSTWIHTSSGDITVVPAHATTADNGGGDAQ
jgi:hypothetical protein